MNYCVYSENEWIYPDSSPAGKSEIQLYAPRNSDVCFQVLADLEVQEGETITVRMNHLTGYLAVYQLLPAHVGENSGAKILTTFDYESVKHFVTRKAPFDVYDITKPVENGQLYAGRAAFYFRIDVEKDAVPESYEGSLSLRIGKKEIEIPVTLKVYETVLPDLKDSSFHMINWIYYKELAKQHQVEFGSEAFREVLTAYLENQLDMRNDYLMIPSGVPVRDAEGKVIDFDFTHAAFVGNLAMEMGFKKILGGFVARFEQWDEAEQWLLWDRQVGVTTLEGYRQLKLYFTKAWKCVQENQWEAHYMQCLVDEPQFPNSLSYRALSGICRSLMLGVKINDPVESTEIYGALDVWVVKQTIFEEYYDTYRELQDMGEELWIYTCGFPAGSTMNRVIDLPLTVSRLTLWLCYHYQCPGFLHWGYHMHNEELEKETCYLPGNDKTIRYPAGNSFVVYPALDGERKPWYSVRGHLQRLGAYDYELFRMLGEKYSFEKADELIKKVCRGFDEYDSSAELLDRVRQEALELLG
ncbi:MAG: DUF4091 domain-containing protein [Chloroflexi bacterium]|nr:DUF4091 domain-containing protein [Chloroflexota bacterium]